MMFMLNAKKITLSFLLSLIIPFSLLSISKDTFIVEWDDLLNQNQMQLDSFLITKENSFQTLDDINKFEVAFYSQELYRYIDGEISFNQTLFNSIVSDDLTFLLSIHHKICSKDTITANDLDRVLALAENRYSTHFDGIVNLMLSEIYFEYKDIGRSLNYADRAINRAELGNYRNLLGASFLHKSNVYFSEGLTERAYANSQKGLFYAKRFKADFWQVLLLQKLGEIQFNIQNYWMARDHWENAYLLAEGKVHELIFAKLIAQLANAYLYIDNHNAASELLNDALVIFYRYNQEKEIGNTHFLYGQILFALKDYNLAERNFKLSISYAKENKYVLGDIYASIAKLKLVQLQAHKALEYANKALASFNEGSSKYYELVYLKADIYAQLNNTKKSSELYKTYISARDSIRKEELQNRIAELNSLFRSEQRERKIIEQQQILDEQESELLLNIQKLENEQLRIRQLFFLIVFIILLFGVIISLVSLRSKQNKLKQEHKSSELKQTLLRSQMNPHFIFNSFSIIQSYIYENDKESSSQFLVNFSRLIRMILENSNKELIPLSEEIDILKRYLYVQKIRFEDRFQYTIEVDNELKKDVEFLEIPPMIAQPFIENAIEHGALQKIKDGKISIQLFKKGDLLEFVIQDNGIGIRESKKRRRKPHKSMAIDITKERIELLNKKYGVNGYIEIVDLNDIDQRGTRVIIQIPCFKKVRD